MSFAKVGLQLLLIIILVKLFFPEIGHTLAHMIATLLAMADQFLSYAQTLAR